jgi:hypothetical protein
MGLFNVEFINDLYKSNVSSDARESLTGMYSRGMVQRISLRGLIFIALSDPC